MRLLITLSLCLLVAVMATLLSGRRTRNTSSRLNDMYLSAQQDAAVVEEHEIYRGLLHISSDAPHIEWRDSTKSQLRVTTWKQQEVYEKFYIPTSEGKALTAGAHVWITLTPQVKQFCSSLSPGIDRDTRLKQYLGLPPDRDYDLFVDLWVSPADLFRPCPDHEINDTSCSLALPDSATMSAEHLSFLEEQKLWNTYPFTRLGYTYDWGVAEGESHVGASEYILRKGASFEVDSAVSTRQYCTK